MCDSKEYFYFSKPMSVSPPWEVYVLLAIFYVVSTLLVVMFRYLIHGHGEWGTSALAMFVPIFIYFFRRFCLFVGGMPHKYMWDDDFVGMFSRNRKNLD